jgi:hypothetical protein
MIRWPLRRHARHRTGSRHSTTRWSVARHLKHWVWKEGKEPVRQRAPLALAFIEQGAGERRAWRYVRGWGASSVPDTSTVTWGQKEMHGARCQSRLRDRGRFLPRILVRLPQPDIQRQRGVKRRNREMNALESCLAPLQCGWSLWTGTGGEGRGTALLMTGSTRPPLGVGHCRAPQRGECASARIVST